MRPTIQMEAYPLIYRVIADAELKLTDLTGLVVKLEMTVRDKGVLTKGEADKIRLQMMVCSEFAMSWKSLVCRSRIRRIVDARKVYCYLGIVVLGLTTVEIGKDLRRDHTSAIHLRKACSNLIETNDPITKIIDRIKTKLYEEV
jgi:ATPase involved in DNA replication initiation